MGRMKKALADFRRAASVAPRDPDLKRKLQLCEKEVRRIRFEEALATPVSTGASNAPACCLLDLLTLSLRILQSSVDFKGSGSDNDVLSGTIAGGEAHRAGD
jgi:hypothetical protein